MVSKSAASPFAAMGETLDFMQKMWSSIGMPMPGNLGSLAGVSQRMPSVLAPTIDVDELDKRIADLRAVEQWLELNASMLRTTIQTLEVQRATIATLKGIGGAMMAPIVGVAQAPRPAPAPVSAAVMAPPPVAETEPVEPVAPPRARQRKPAPEAGPSLAEDALNPAAWWQALQQQFAHIASRANEPEPEPVARKPARRRKRKAR